MQKHGVSFVMHDPTTPSRKREFHIQPNPEEIQSTKNPRTTLQMLSPSKDNEPNVYRESFGLGIEQVTLQGTFGYKKRQVGSRTLSGTELFFEFEKFYEKYFELRSNPSRDISDNTKLEYHNWDEDRHYWAEFGEFSKPRSQENRTFYKYDVELNLYAPIKGKKLTVKKPDPKRLASQYEKFFKRLAKDIQKAGETLSKFAADVISTINRFVLRPMQDLINAFESFLNGVTDTVFFLPQAILKTADTINRIIEQITDFTSNKMVELLSFLRSGELQLRRLYAQPEMFQQSINAGMRELSGWYHEIISELDSTEERDDKLLGLNQQHLRAAQDVAGGAYQGASRVQVRATDTLPKIAAKFYGDAGRWREIALFNKLEYPYIVDPSGPDKDKANTVQWGKYILVPANTGDDFTGVVGALGAGQPVNQPDLEERLYGTDLRVYQGHGGLTIRLGPNGDPDLVSGGKNLIQSVSLRGTIERGHLPEEPNYGLRKLLEIGRARV